MLASRARWWRLGLGIALLWPLQGWGIGFDFLAQLGAKLGPEVARQARLFESREFIAFAYQAGALIFPSLAPVAAWFSLNGEFADGMAVRK